MTWHWYGMAWFWQGLAWHWHARPGMAHEVLGGPTREAQVGGSTRGAQVGGPTWGPSGWAHVGPKWVGPSGAQVGGPKLGPGGPKPEIWDPKKSKKQKFSKSKSVLLKMSAIFFKPEKEPPGRIWGPLCPFFAWAGKNPKKQKKCLFSLVQSVVPLTTFHVS